MIDFLGFFSGNFQGRHQPKERLGVVDHYIYELLQATESLTLEILASKSRTEIAGKLACIHVDITNHRQSKTWTGNAS